MPTDPMSGETMVVVSSLVTVVKVVIFVFKVTDDIGFGDEMLYYL